MDAFQKGAAAKSCPCAVGCMASEAVAKRALCSASLAPWLFISASWSASMNDDEALAPLPESARTRLGAAGKGRAVCAGPEPPVALSLEDNVIEDSVVVDAGVNVDGDVDNLVVVDVDINVDFDVHSDVRRPHQRRRGRHGRR